MPSISSAAQTLSPFSQAQPAQPMAAEDQHPPHLLLADFGIADATRPGIHLLEATFYRPS